MADSEWFGNYFGNCRGNHTSIFISISKITVEFIHTNKERSMEVGKELGEIAKKHGKAMAIEMVDQVLFIALDDVVAKSATPIDDVVLAALKEPLKKSLKDALEKI